MTREQFAALKKRERQVKPGAIIELFGRCYRRAIQRKPR
jgi:hypothetical protein